MVTAVPSLMQTETKAKRSNTNESKIERYARVRGLSITVIKSEGNASGRYFIASRNGKLLTHWGRLGWTLEDAFERIEQELVLNADSEYFTRRETEAP